MNSASMNTDDGIEFENGQFVFESYHDDRLIDAANYARLRQHSVVDAP